MRYLGRVWHELTRPRGPERHRFYRVGRRSNSGVALVIVLAIITFMTVIVTEIGYAATVRVQLAAHQRDEAKAEALAWSGVNFYRLILVASKQLGSNSQFATISSMMGMAGGDTLWQMLPFFNSGFLRMLLVSGPTADEEDVAEYKTEGLSEEEIAETRESKGSMRNFLDFDGDFMAEVEDEDRKINITSFSATTYADLLQDPTALKLYALMSGMRNWQNTLPDGAAFLDQAEEEREDHDQFFYEKNIERWELIGNLADWTDADNTRLYEGGNEDSLYNNLLDPYLPKNAPFDTLDEIRLVDGWHDDDVWERYGQYITVYGSGKVNVNSAQREVLWALIKAYAQGAPDSQVEEIIRYIEEYRLMGSFSNARDFANYVTQAYPVVDSTIQNGVSTQSTVFRVTSTGVVNEASVKIVAVFDFGSSSTGEVVYWRVE